MCTYCNAESTVDEFLYILQCKHFCKDRLLYLKRAYLFLNLPAFTLQQAMNPSTNNYLLLFGKFIRVSVIIKK